jgi:hypothetical protein
MAAMAGRGPEPLLRALAVVALLAVAALALQARQGLDWSELADPVEVQWARVVFGTVLLLAVIAAGRRLLRRARQRRRPRGREDGPEPEGEPFPWTLRGLGLVLVLAALGLVWFLVESLGTPGQSRRNQPGRLNNGALQEGPTDSPDTGSTWQILLLTGTVLLVVAIGSRWLAARRAAAEAEAGPDDEQRAEVERLVAAVDAAEVELRGPADPREAVLAAYAAMARQLSSGLARRGRGLRPSDTAGELLDSAVDAGLVSGTPARTLTDLFREARYSEHPIGEEARTTAGACLAEVRSELTARHG